MEHNIRIISHQYVGIQ